MRRWLLLVLVLLLPLRGWMGEAMAGEMLARHVALAAAAAAPGQEAHAHMHGHEAAAAASPALAHDCAGHGQGHAHGPGDAHAAADMQAPQPLPDLDCGTCASCQICSSVALGFVVSALPLMVFGHAPPASGVPQFASAEPRAGDKPPRS